jgi:copper homeostasis protein
MEAARAAEAGGADRIELCAKLTLGGVSPPFDLLAVAIRELRIPVHVLIRPRDGDFCFSPSEFELMKLQIAEAKKAGAAGVAIGVLLADGRVDVARSRELAELAHPMKSTFHRAFDEAPDLDEALEDVISTGADCLLTSGGAKDVLAGAASIARLREGAGQRLNVMAGGGLRLHTLTDVVRKTGVAFLHGSLTRREPGTQDAGPENAYSILEADVREAVRLFRQEFDSNWISTQ